MLRFFLIYIYYICENKNITQLKNEKILKDDSS